MNLYLGLIYKVKNGKQTLVNHRSLLKIVFNPFLRYFFNCCINTKYDSEKDIINGYNIVFRENKGQKRTLLEELKSSWIYKPDFEIIIKKKIKEYYEKDYNYHNL